MKIRERIMMLVSMQIILIITSFLIIVYFESQTNLTGNMVNIAGKNRVLTSMVQVELTDAILHGKFEKLELGSSIDDLEKNILFLRDGGRASGIEIPPLPDNFEGEWNSIWSKFVQYKSEVSEIARHGGTDRTGDMLDDVRRTGSDLVEASDILTDSLGHNVETLSFQLIALQLSMCIINVIAHIAMIIIIWKILFRHTEKQMAAEKFSAIGELASAMAHDMKNPLGAIRLSAELIGRRMKDREPNITSETAIIERCVRRMTHQIDGVLNQMNSVMLSQESVSALEIIHGALEIVDIPDNVSVSLPKNDLVVRCDKNKMEFVFANLLLNAVQSMKDGGGRIDIRLAEVREGAKGHLVLEFENSGPPIPKSDLSRIFEPLFTTRLSGTGLGLASCKNVVEAHGGSIDVQEEPVKFTIRLPTH